MKSLSEIILGGIAAQTWGGEKVLFVKDLMNRIDNLQEDAQTIWLVNGVVKTAHQANPCDATHVGMLIGIEPINQLVTKEEVIDFIKRRGDYTRKEMDEFIERIQTNGIRS